MSPAYRSVHGERPTLRPLYRLLPLLLIAILFIAPVVPAIAQDTSLLYSENFNDGSAQDWWLNSNAEGSWRVKNGQLVGSEHVWATFLDVEWGSGPYTLEFDLSPLGVGNGLHVNLHHSDEARYYVGFRELEAGQMLVYVDRNKWGKPPKELASNAGDLFPYRDFDQPLNVVILTKTDLKTGVFANVNLLFLSKPGRKNNF